MLLHSTDLLLVANIMANAEYEDDYASSLGGGEEISSTLETVEGNDEDLLHYERAIREIARGDSYQCLICTVEMDHQCQMFACRKCFRVFDYDCIREWAIKSTGSTKDATWKCPNCSVSSKRVPAKNKATCWCGKVVNPDPNALSPNSCGQTCNARICPHGCTQMCHLGPHVSCSRTKMIKCRCGKNRKAVACMEAKKLIGKYRCDEPCGKLLRCGKHTCKRKCHDRDCGPCPEKVVGTQEEPLLCYCGNSRLNSMRCKDIKVPKPLKYSVNSRGDRWIGSFKCNATRTIKYSCGYHSFQEPCIAPPSLNKKRACPYSPKKMKTCPCGRTKLNNLSVKRESCKDPVPTCDSICNKLLSCGKHRCEFQCHEGDCLDPCIRFERTRCSCEQSIFITPCGFHGKPKCNLKCESNMSCRRHKCAERCCAGRPAAQRRKKMFLNKQDINDESLVEAEHICLKECSRTLSCGKHNCTMKCHPGKCPPCLVSDSEDLVCPCGRTVVEAPVRCGTSLPSCPYLCIKVIRNDSSCGHTPLAHPCHPVDTPCPPCTAPVQKPCHCGKRNDVRTICMQNDVSCGLLCGKKLPNCHHSCQKSCHKVGECQARCKQVCGKQRENCEHSCPKPCHGSVSCPDLPCTRLVEVTCNCGRITDKVVCGATSNKAGEARGKTLSCDDECFIVQRNNRLKEAFGMLDSNATHNSELNHLKQLVSVANTYAELELPFTEPIMAAYRRSPAWCESIEQELDSLVKSSQRASHHFKPMKASQRDFVHELAKSYGLYSESQDREPKRSVFVMKKGDIIRAPAVRLADAYPLYESFKLHEKNQKKTENARPPAQSSSTSTASDSILVAPVVPSPASMNGLIVRQISEGVTIEELQVMFADALSKTLIIDPQYEFLTGAQDILIYPANYKDATQNVERDLRALVGHFQYLCLDNLVAKKVELCRVEDSIPQPE